MLKARFGIHERTTNFFVHNVALFNQYNNNYPLMQNYFKATRGLSNHFYVNIFFFIILSLSRLQRIQLVPLVVFSLICTELVLRCVTFPKRGARIFGRRKNGEICISLISQTYATLIINYVRIVIIITLQY